MSKTVLVVDDDADIRELAELSLARVGGWEVRVAASGDEALVLAAEDPPRVVLLDVMMPGRDGPQTLQRLREQEATAAVPVVFLTAKAQRAERERLLEEGAIGVLAKPFDPMALPAELERLLEAAGR